MPEKRECQTCGKEQVSGQFKLGGVDLGQCQTCTRKAGLIASAGYRYRLRPTPEQRKQMEHIAGACCWIYNSLVRMMNWHLIEWDAERRRVWAETRQRLFPEVEGRLSDAQYKAIKTEVPKVPFPEKFSKNLLYTKETAYEFVKLVRADPEWFGRDVKASILRDAASEFYVALANWGAGRARRPKVQRPSGFKLISQESVAVSAVKPDGVLLEKGSRLRWVRHRPWRGVPRSVTVSKDAAGRWYASLLCSWIQAPRKHRGDDAVGLDPGVVTALTASDGQALPSVRPYCMPLAEKKAQKMQRKMRRILRARARAGLSTDSRAMKIDGVYKSKRYQRVLRQMAKLDIQQANWRSDRQWKFAQQLASQYTLVVFEGSKVQQLSKRKIGAGARGRAANRYLVGEAWYAAQTKLAAKCAAYGGHFMTVPAAYTSQRCYACGEVDKASRPNQATFVCQHCGHQDNADHNAAKNIRAIGCALVLAGVEHVSSDVKAVVARAEIPEWSRALIPVYQAQHAKAQAKTASRSKSKAKTK